MKLPIGAGTHSVVFLEGTSEVLAAVVAGLKGHIRDGKRAVDQKEDRVFQTLLVNIICNGTIHIPGE